MKPKLAALLTALVGIAVFPAFSEDVPGTNQSLTLALPVGSPHESGSGGLQAMDLSLDLPHGPVYTYDKKYPPEGKPPQALLPSQTPVESVPVWQQPNPGNLPPDEAISTITILPEDVVRDSIQRFHGPRDWFGVRWQYTEAGAKKMRFFRNTHAGQRVRTRVGNFETPPGLVLTNRTVRGDNVIPWEKVRTDKFLGLSAADADAVVAGLKGKRADEVEPVSQDAEKPR